MDNLYSFLARFFGKIGHSRGRQLAQPHKVSKHNRAKRLPRNQKEKRKKRRQMARDSRRINRKR